MDRFRRWVARRLVRTVFWLTARRYRWEFRSATAGRVRFTLQVARGVDPEEVKEHLQLMEMADRNGWTLVSCPPGLLEKL